MSKSQNIIQRRDLDPLLLRAREVIKHYEKAAECAVAVLEPELVRQTPEDRDASLDYSAVEDSGRTMFFCTLCKKFTGRESSCAVIHQNGIREARRLGGTYIYVCPMGFIYWTSPIYTGERFAGALLSGGVLSPGQKSVGVNRRQAAENIFRFCDRGISREEIESFLEDVPEKTDEEIKALAQMLLICAEQISAGDISASFRDVPLHGGEAQSWTAADLGGEAGENSYPLDKERMLLAALRRGDNAKGRQILKELLDILAASGSANFKIFQLRAIELAVMLSRAAADPADAEDQNILETNNRYLQKIEEARSPAVIYEILNVILDRISGKIFSFQGIRHSSALRRAERFIWENYTRKISLQEIATASGLSAPYFSTIFKDEMGENLSNYLNRLRVEKASAMLAETDLPISGIAAACGFEDQSWFSKIFKNHTGLSPGKYREKGGMYSPMEYN